MGCTPSVIPQFLKTYWSTSRASDGGETTSTYNSIHCGYTDSSMTVGGYSVVTLFITEPKEHYARRYFYLPAVGTEKWIMILDDFVSSVFEKHLQ